MTISRVTSKCISIAETSWLNSPWISRGFVSATRPSQKAAKLDKETCGKVIEAAETVKDGTKEVVKEVKTVRSKVTNTTEDMVTDAAEKGFEKASETSESDKSKVVLDTAKAATEAYKEKKGQ